MVYNRYTKKEQKNMQYFFHCESFHVSTELSIKNHEVCCDVTSIDVGDCSGTRQSRSDYLIVSLEYISPSKP